MHDRTVDKGYRRGTGDTGHSARLTCAGNPARRLGWDSKYDLKILYRGGRTGAAEVVSTRDQARMSLSSAAGKRGYSRCSELTRLWIVEVFPGTNTRENAKGIRALLVQLEQAGVNRLSRADRHPLTPIVHDLGIGSCWSSAPTTKHSPGFYVTPDAFGAWVGDSESVRKFCEEF